MNNLFLQSSQSWFYGLISIVTFIFFLFGSHVYADASAFSKWVPDSLLVADFNITGGAVIENTVRDVTVGFTLQNNFGVQNGVRYGLELRKVGEESEIVDEFAATGTLSLAEGESVYLEMTYTPPASLDGTYELYVVSYTHKGHQLAYRSLGQVNFEEITLDANLKTIACSSDTMSAGFISCTVENESNDSQQVSVQTSIRQGNVFGLTEGEVYSQILFIPANEELEFEVIVPSDITDGNYTIVNEILTEENILLSRDYFNTRVGRLTSSILNTIIVDLDDSYGLFVSVLRPNTATNIVVTPELEKGSCVVTNTLVEDRRVIIPLSSDCTGGVTISLQNEETVVDEEFINLPEKLQENEVSDEAKPNSNLMIAFIGGLLITIIYFVLVRKSKVMMVLFLGLVLLGASEVFAASKTYECAGAGPECADNNVTVLGDVYLNKDTFSPGEQITGLVSLSASRGDKFLARSIDMYVGGDCPPEGCPQNNIFLPSYTGSANFVVNDAGPRNFNLNGFYAPSTPGNYYISFASGWPSVPSTHYLADWSYDAIPITVTAPPSYQCSDGSDNDGDGRIDIDDPGCHSDCNASNPASYVPNDNSEQDSCVATTASLSASPSSYCSSSDSTLSWSVNPSNVVVDLYLNGSDTGGNVSGSGNSSLAGLLPVGTHTLSLRQNGVVLASAMVTVNACSCTGFIPTNAVSWDAINGGNDETTNLSGNTPWSYSASDTSAKCQYTCSGESTWNGSSCVPQAFSCTGVIPQNAVRFDAEEEQGLSVDTPWSYSASDTSVKCQFRCSFGTWDAGSGQCVQNPSSFTLSAATGSCGGNINLSWTPSSGATSYTVLRFNGVSFVSIASGLSQTSYTDTGRTPGVSYSYLVRATNSSGTSDSNGSSAVASPSCDSGAQNYQCSGGCSPCGSVGQPLCGSTTYTSNTCNNVCPVVIDSEFNLISEINPVVQSGTLVQNQSVKFRGRVRDGGTVPPTTAFYDNFKYCWGEGCDPNTGSLLNEIYRESSQFGNPRVLDDESTELNLANSGTLRVQHCVDSRLSVSENNELDNCRVSSFVVSPSSNTAPVPTISSVNGEWGMTLGNSIDLRISATDSNNDMTNLNFDFVLPPNAWNWQGGGNGSAIPSQHQNSFSPRGSHGPLTYRFTPSSAGTYTVGAAAFDNINPWQHAQRALTVCPSSSPWNGSVCDDGTSGSGPKLILCPQADPINMEVNQTRNLQALYWANAGSVSCNTNSPAPNVVTSVSNWSSSNTAVGSVNNSSNKGLVTGISEGSLIARAAYNGLSATKNIIVTAQTYTPPPNIEIKANPSIVRSGETADVEVSVEANYSLVCEVFGATRDVFNHAAPRTERDYVTDTLTSARIVRIECTDPAGATTDKEVRIEVIPTFQEI